MSVSSLRRISLLGLSILICIGLQALGYKVMADPLTETAAQTIHQAALAQIDKLPTDSLDQFWRNLMSQYNGYLPDIQGTSLLRAVFDGGFHPSHLLAGLSKYFLDAVLDHARLVGGILILAVLASVLETMQTAFEQKAVSQIAYAVIFLVLLVLAIGSFTEAVGTAKHAIETMDHFMLATIPLAVALLAASGSVATAAFFQPMMLFVVHLITNVVFFLIFPLIFFSAILDVTSSLSTRYSLTRLAALLRMTGLAMLSLCMTTFLGVVTVRGIGKGIVDGVTLRAVKYSVGTFVPVIGKAVADASETVLSASLLVKNAVGMTGLLLIALIAIFPALKLLAMAFIYSGSAALMQPLGESAILDCLATLAKSLLLVFGCVLAVALMFFLAICILLASANVAVMMA
ncbi:stage III sporulation protein AE [Alicyclobacillus tolerans]|uniref:Stage III sporulation protein AE n=2 Tax=Alicyclobacillus tolerans TaxID=90970 RepID=A0A1M6S3S8_9BACL|nr:MULTISPECIES: stage III sporulation protein AE [Alicyclobacillus]MDP9728747.1 stage III sporulation protein AE [Alicyclobacillus tengchongensis]SHK39299.1 stage III sporulation protein AE [Alicyclobacillus montanus]